jgi:hypothetical protein
MCVLLQTNYIVCIVCVTLNYPQCVHSTRFLARCPKCAQLKFLMFSFNLWSRFMFPIWTTSFPICVCAQVFSLCVLRLCSYLCSSFNLGFNNNSRFPCVCECMFTKFLASIGSTITTSNNIGFLIVVSWWTTKVSSNLCLCFPFMGVLQVCVHVSYVCVGGLIKFQVATSSIVITNNIGFLTTPS